MAVKKVTSGLLVGHLATESDQRRNVKMQLQDWDILILLHAQLTRVLIHPTAQITEAPSNGTLEQAPLMPAILMTIVYAE